MVQLKTERLNCVDVLNIYIGDINIEIDSRSYAVIVGVTIIHGCRTGKELLEQILRGDEVEIDEGKFLDYICWVNGKCAKYGIPTKNYYRDIISAMEKSGVLGGENNVSI